MQTSCYGWKACARLAAARAQPQPQPQPELQSQSQSQLLRRAVRQSDGRADRQTNEGEGGRERRTSKDPKHAQSEEVRPGRQSAVVVEIGCETVSHGITITTHTNTRAHTQPHKHTQSHSNIEAQPQLKSFYCPQHKRAQRASVSESGRASTHTHHRAYVNRSQQRNNNSCSRRKREGRIQFSSRTRQNARLTRTLSGSAARAEPIKSTTRTAS